MKVRRAENVMMQNEGGSGVEKQGRGNIGELSLRWKKQGVG